MQYLIFQWNHFYVLSLKKTKNLNVIRREISRQKRFNISSVGYVPLKSNTALPLQIEVHFKVDWLGHHSFIKINGYWWLESERGLVKSSKRTVTPHSQTPQRHHWPHSIPQHPHLMVLLHPLPSPFLWSPHPSLCSSLLSHLL